jgi:hypothetical protein
MRAKSLPLAVEVETRLEADAVQRVADRGVADGPRSPL